MDRPGLHFARFVELFSEIRTHRNPKLMPNYAITVQKFLVRVTPWADVKQI